MPRCLIIAGPNGAWKTTFARAFLPGDAIMRFIKSSCASDLERPMRPVLSLTAS